MEMYKVKATISVTTKVEKSLLVFAEDMDAAVIEAEQRVRNLDEHALRRQIYDGRGSDFTTHVHHVTPKAVVPEKGVPRSALTKIQKQTLKNLIDGGAQARLSFDPGMNTWINSGASDYTRHVDSRTVIALRKKNLIIPIAMTKEERKVQEALGTMEVGSFAFILNMKEVQKRKVYKDAKQIRP